MLSRPHTTHACEWHTQWAAPDAPEMWRTDEGAKPAIRTNKGTKTAVTFSSWLQKLQTEPDILSHIFLM